MWEMGKGEAGSLARKTFLTPFFKEIDMLNPTSYGISDSVAARGGGGFSKTPPRISRKESL